MSAISTWDPASGGALSGEGALLPVRIRSRGARWAILAVGVAVVLGAGWWVTNSPVFDMRSLRIEGTRHLSPGEVAGLSGLDERSNVMWLSRAAVRERLEANPWIRSATVARDLPSGITIKVVERSPVAVTSGAHPMLVAADGTVLGPAPHSIRLPSIPATGALRVGEHTSVSPELSAIAALSRSARSRVASVTRDAEGSLVLHLRDGLTVFYGDPSAPEAKAKALQTVLGWAARKGIHPAYVDVRAPSAPAVGTSSLVTVSPSA